MPRTCRENAENLLTQPPRLHGARLTRSAPPKSHGPRGPHTPGHAIHASVYPALRGHSSRGHSSHGARSRLTRPHGSRPTWSHGSRGHAGLGGLGVTGHLVTRVTGHGSRVSGHGSCVRVRVREGGEGRGRTFTLLSETRGLFSHFQVEQGARSCPFHLLFHL